MYLYLIKGECKLEMPKSLWEVLLLKNLVLCFSSRVYLTLSFKFHSIFISIQLKDRIFQVSLKMLFPTLTCHFVCFGPHTALSIAFHFFLGSESDTTQRLHFHFSLSCIGEGNGNPLQCSCLESPRDGGAWWAAVSGVDRIGPDQSDLAAAAA